MNPSRRTPYRRNECCGTCAAAECAGFVQRQVGLHQFLGNLYSLNRQFRGIASGIAQETGRSVLPEDLLWEARHFQAIGDAVKDAANPALAPPRPGRESPQLPRGGRAPPHPFGGRRPERPREWAVAGFPLQGRGPVGALLLAESQRVLLLYGGGSVYFVPNATSVCGRYICVYTCCLFPSGGGNSPRRLGRFERPVSTGPARMRRGSVSAFPLFFLWVPAPCRSGVYVSSTPCP